MSPHQTATKIVAEFLGCPEEQAAGGPLASRICDSIQAASNEELNRRRERVAALEAALKDAREGFEQLATLTSVGYEGIATHGEMHRDAIDAALSGGTSALDAAIAESTAKLTEERDALAAKNAALANMLETFWESFKRTHGHTEECTCKGCEGVREALKTRGGSRVERRDARIRAEGRKAGLEEAASAMKGKLKAARIGAADNQKIITLAGAHATLEQLAAQAGEGTNAD